MSKMLKSSGSVAAATMVSRVLGLIREVVYARFMGAGWVADAFTLAFMIPNLFRRLLGEGALTAAFIPIFKQQEKQEGEEAMWRSANAVLSGLTLVLTGLALLAMAGVTLVLLWGDLEGKNRLMLSLLRLMFPYVVLVCVAALFMGMLNARGHFFIPALGSALLNVVLIASVLGLAPRLGVELREQVFGLAIGVLVAGLVQALFQWPLLRREGYPCRWVSPWRNPSVRKVVRQMIPGTVGVAAYQINVLLTNGVAYLVDDGIVAAFNYAVRLMELPQGVFGLSMATYLLPTLAGLAAEKKYPEFRQTLETGMGHLLLVNLLASALLLTLAEPIVRLLFEGGSFDAADTARAAMAVRWLAPGLVAFSTVNILARAFYSLGDLRTPVRISIFCLTLNVVLVLILIWRFREAAMGFANTATGLINGGLLIYALRKKLSQLNWATLRQPLPFMIMATVAAGAVAWATGQACEGYWGHVTLPTRLTGVFLPIAAASLVYLALNVWLKVPYIKDWLRLWPGITQR